jgi:hypothetical protein
MYLFSRTSTADPERIFDATAFATDIAATASSISGLEVQAWAATYGAPVGTITWSAVVPSQTAMGAASEKLLADATYLEKVRAASDLFVGAMEDAIVDMVAMAGDGGHTGEYVTLVQAQCAVGHTAEAMTWGVDMMNHVAGVTGRDGVFGRSMYGPWGGVGWLSLAASLDEVDAATAAIAADPTYIEKLDAAGPLFVPGASRSMLSRRIA